MDKRFTMTLAASALFFSIAGCKPKSPNLASQIGPVTATVGAFDNAKGERLQEARFKFRNNGPVEVGVVYAKIDVYDANGAKTDDSTNEYCIFSSNGPAERIKPGQEIEKQPGHGYLLSPQAVSVNRVEAVITRAEQDSGVDIPPN